MGTNALLSLMTATVVERELASRLASFPSTTSSATLPTSPSSLSTVNAILSSSTAVSTTSLGSDVSMSADDQEMYKVGVATSISFICGILLLTMGLLRCGFISNFMSTSFLGGFTTAAGFHIFSSQIAKILHIKISAQSGAGKLVKTYISIFSHVTEANAADVIIGAVSIAFLLVLTFINEKYKQHMKVPIPTHLILVVIATVVSHFADFKGMWDIAVVGRVATGFRTPAIPPLGVMGSIAMDAVVIAVMAYALTIAMAKMMSKQHSYPIDDDQELVAYGLCNLLGAFFSCQPNATAPPRTMLLSLTGARSTLCGVPVAAFICVVIMAAGSLFENLPVAVLAAMIMTAVKNLLMQVLTLPSLWRISKPDFLIWVVTCLVGVFADLDYAIIVGVFGSVLSVVVATQLASSQVGGVSATEDLILSNHNREGITPPSGTKIFYFPSPLYFANAEKFKNELYQKILDPTIDVEETIPLNDKNLTTQTIVIDCSAMTYADIAGINILKLVSSKYQAIGVKVYLSKCPEYLLGILRRADFFSTFPKECVVYGVFDALLLN